MRNHSYLNLRTPAFLLILVAAAFPARAAMLFSNPTGDCIQRSDSPDIPTGPAGGTPVKGGARLSFWATCGLAATVDGLNGFGIIWEVLYDGTPPTTVTDYPLDWDFSITGPAGQVIEYSLEYTVWFNLGQPGPHTEGGHLITDRNTPPGGGTIRGSYTRFFDDSEPVFFRFDLNVAFQGQIGDTLTVTVPEHSSIDLNNPHDSVPEPATAFFMFTGLGGAVLLSRRRVRARTR